MSNIRFLFISLAALLGLLLFAVSAYAQGPALQHAEEGLTVTDVIVDKTDKNAVAARDQAIIEAQRMAFQNLAGKFMTPEIFKNWSLPDDKIIATLVQDFEIRNEQISANRYVAHFTVRFMPAAADYLKTAGGGGSGSTLPQMDPSAAVLVPAAASAPSAPLSILVLPYFKNISGRSVLWEDPNPWRETWRELGNSTPYPGLTITVPLGDIADISFGSAEAVWAGDYSVIEKLRDDYKANEVVMAVASKSDTYTQVDIYTYKNGRITGKKSLPPYAGGDDYKAVFQQTIARIISDTRAEAPLPTAAVDETAPFLGEVAASLQKPAEIQPAPEKITLEAMMDFSSPAQWMEAQKRLSAVSPSLTVGISSLRKNAAWFTITADSSGGIDGFKESLAGKGIELALPLPLPDVGMSPSGTPVYILKMN